MKWTPAATIVCAFSGLVPRRVPAQPGAPARHQSPDCADSGPRCIRHMAFLLSSCLDLDAWVCLRLLSLSGHSPNAR